jgi:capsular exopolysaccharide synthesis family protein
MLFAENRRLERVCVQYPVEIKRLGDSLTGHGVVSDLSSSGISCYVESKLNLRSDDEVEISIFMNDTPDRQAVLRGVVLRSKAAIAGYHFSTTAIRFTSASDALSERVRAIVQATAGAPSFALPPHFKEPIRGLRSDILFMSNQGMSSFLMTSCGPQEGKSTIVCNLAIAIAEINKRVVVVDANLRSPTVHEIMNLPNERGLSNVLLESTDPYVAKTKSGVSVLTSGTPVPDPSALLGSYEMIRLVKFLDDGFDFVLFDSPPLLAGPDSALLASLAHGVIIVLNAGGTTVDDLRRGKQILDRSNAKTLGIVMNNFEDESASYYAWSSDYGKKSS